MTGWLFYVGGMACRISEIVINARDPSRLAVFWCEVLGYAEIGRSRIPAV